MHASEPSNVGIPRYARMSLGTHKIARIYLACLLPCWAHVSQATEAHICYLQQRSTIYNHLQPSANHEHLMSTVTLSNHPARKRCSKEVNKRAWILHCYYFSEQD